MPPRKQRSVRKTRRPKTSRSGQMSPQKMQQKGRLDRELESVMDRVPAPTRDYMIEHMGDWFSLNDIPTAHRGRIETALKKKS